MTRMPPYLRDFLQQHQLALGDRVRVEWKGMHVEGLILPQPETNLFLNLKMDSGYNTGLALDKITHAEKQAHLPPKPRSTQTPAHPPHDESNARPAFSLIGVGGTIASKVNYESGGVSAKLTPDELSEMVPEIKEFAKIHQIVSPFTKMSEDIVPADWIRIAQACHAELSNPDVQGVVVTHGTDTLHYTAAALSFMLRGLSKPVVLVGSQRSSDRGSSDATMNLICSARVAVSDMAEVGICMHGTTSDDYCLFTRGSAVRKMHTSRRDAFRPMNRLPLAKVWPDGRMESVSPFTPRSTESTTLDAVFEEKVALLKMYPGLPASTLEHLAEKGIKGMIIEGTGLGHVATSLIPTIKALTQRGIFVFMTSQTLYGRVDLNVYTNLRLLQNAGAIGLEDMLPEVAYVKLGWVLAHTHDPQKVKEMMHTNYAGEISTTSRTDTFLY